MMAEESPNQENASALALYRKLLAFAGSVYFSWWFAVEALLPNSFNPLPGRLGVVSFIFVVLAGSFLSGRIRAHIRNLFVFGTWLITIHYYFLFYGNGGDPNWIVGCFITVMAISLCILSRDALLWYSVLTFVLSALLVFLVPSLTHSVFLPGMVTIVFQANIGLRSRLGLIKNLEESNQRFQLLFNSTFEGVLVHDNGRILDVNDALLRMSDYRREELIGRDVLHILDPSSHHLISEKMRATEAGPYEAKGLTRTGRAVDLEIRAKSFVYNKKTVRLVTALDITDRKRAEKDRITSLTLAENVRVRDDFISIASHELRTPLSSLELQVQLIERDLKKAPSKTELPGNLAESLPMFRRQIQRLTELVETMLDVSRISAGRFVLDLQKIDFAAIVRGALVPLEMKAKIENPKFRIHAEIPEHLYLLGDSLRLQQVVENLVTNAIKYGNGKPVFVRLHHVADRAIFIVEDQGLGIAPEYLERIFDRFERAVSARNITGFGLGLYIIRQIVEAHQGEVAVNSRLDVGSTFTIRIPVTSSP